MFSEIARVFSSQGVLVGRAGYAYVYGSKAPENPRVQPGLKAQTSESENSFGAHFDQASAKLELSKQAALAPSDPSGQDRAVAIAAANMAQEAAKKIAEKKGPDSSSSMEPGAKSPSPYSRSLNQPGKSLSVYA